GRRAALKCNFLLYSGASGLVHRPTASSPPDGGRSVSVTLACGPAVDGRVFVPLPLTPKCRLRLRGTSYLWGRIAMSAGAIRLAESAIEGGLPKPPPGRLSLAAACDPPLAPPPLASPPPAPLAGLNPAAASEARHEPIN